MHASIRTYQELHTAKNLHVRKLRRLHSLVREQYIPESLRELLKHFLEAVAKNHRAARPDPTRPEPNAN